MECDSLSVAVVMPDEPTTMSSKLGKKKSCQRNQGKVNATPFVPPDRVVGASAGEEVRCVRVELSSGNLHGHPITPEEYQDLLRPR